MERRQGINHRLHHRNRPAPLALRLSHPMDALRLCDRFGLRLRDGFRNGFSHRLGDWLRNGFGDWLGDWLRHRLRHRLCNRFRHRFRYRLGDQLALLLLLGHRLGHRGRLGGGLGLAVLLGADELTGRALASRAVATLRRMRRMMLAAPHRKPRHRQIPRHHAQTQQQRKRPLENIMSLHESFSLRNFSEKTRNPISLCINLPHKFSFFKLPW